MVARQTLTLFVRVQILLPQPGSGIRSLLNRGVAQLGRALRSGRRSRRFKSSHLDQTESGRKSRSDSFLVLKRTLAPKTASKMSILARLSLNASRVQTLFSLKMNARAENGI